MRQIVLDTETTGISPEAGHRIIEIGCVELFDRKLTGNHFHVYINPEREVDEGAFKVHGISTAFLQDKPLFQAIVEPFLAFITDAELIIHNAPFDVGFLSHELLRLQWPYPFKQYCTVLDTLALAKKKHPGQRNSLDALCKRYDIDNSNRQLHGALLDAEILASVYLAMTGGQVSLFDESSDIPSGAVASTQSSRSKASSPATLVIELSDEEKSAHQSFVEFIVKKSNINLWEETVEE